LGFLQSPQWGFRFSHRGCGDENTLKNSQKAADRARRPKLPEGTRAPVETHRNPMSGRPPALEKKYKPGHGGDESG
jgi:hypothetical protein